MARKPNPEVILYSNTRIIQKDKADEKKMSVEFIVFYYKLRHRQQVYSVTLLNDYWSNEVTDFLSDQKFTFKYLAFTNRFLGDQRIFYRLCKSDANTIEALKIFVLKRVFN